MTTTVTMDTAVLGPSGLMATGSTQTLEDGFAAELIHSKRATRVTPQNTGGAQVFANQLSGGGLALQAGGAVLFNPSNPVSINSRDGMGRVTSYTSGGVTYTVTYGSFGPSTISGGGVTRTVSYNAAGQVTGMTDA